MNTKDPFQCQGCVQTDVLSGNHKTKSGAPETVRDSKIKQSMNRPKTIDKNSEETTLENLLITMQEQEL